MADRLVLMVDGPHAGQLVRLSEGVSRWVVPTAPPWVDAIETWPVDPDQSWSGVSENFVYEARTVTIFGRQVEVAWSGAARPSDETLALHLLSTNALQASR